VDNVDEVDKKRDVDFVHVVHFVYAAL